MKYPQGDRWVRGRRKNASVVAIASSFARDNDLGWIGGSCQEGQGETGEDDVRERCDENCTEECMERCRRRCERRCQKFSGARREQCLEECLERCGLCCRRRCCDDDV